jgi:hypothetical protein
MNDRPLTIRYAFDGSNMPEDVTVLDYRAPTSTSSNCSMRHCATSRIGSSPSYTKRPPRASSDRRGLAPLKPDPVRTMRRLTAPDKLPPSPEMGPSTGGMRNVWKGSGPDQRHRHPGSPHLRVQPTKIQKSGSSVANVGSRRYSGVAKRWCAPPLVASSGPTKASLAWIMFFSREGSWPLLSTTPNRCPIRRKSPFEYPIEAKGSKSKERHCENPAPTHHGAAGQNWSVSFS